MKQGQTSQILLRQSNQFKKVTSITSNTTNKSNDASQQIADTFTKIHDTIDNLDSKVNILLEKHEAQFLFAWRNHIKKIKKQLYDIKERADEKEKQMNSNQKLVALEKQMTLFRDQSLRLYQEVEERKSELEIFKRKIKQQQAQLQALREENKQLVRNTKMAQAKNNLYQERISQLQKLSQLRNSVIEGEKLSSPLKKKLSVYSNLTKDNFYQTHQKKNTLTLSKEQLERYNLNTSIGVDRIKGINTNQQNVFNPFYIPTIKGPKLNKLLMTASKHNNIGQLSNTKNSAQQSNKKRHLSILQSSSRPQNHTTFIMIEPTVYDTDLKNWFLDCVKSIKKEISSRKIGFSSTANDILKVQSLQEFKTIDKLRLLEMFLQNEKLLVYMYQKIFPDRMKEIETYLQASNHNHQQQNLSGEEKMLTPKNKITQNLPNQQQIIQLADQGNGKIEEFLNNDFNFKYQNSSKIRVKSVSKASKSQPIRNRVIMKNGKLSLVF